MKNAGNSSDETAKKPPKNFIASESKCVKSLMAWLNPKTVLAAKNSLNVRDVILIPLLPNGSK
ncbi:hypothetical protein CHITON_0737 [Thermococcus chitonophagus]|uniref:Uncharacterized protein n=1 Tax=Thermococcus chitonophagus TaxID=54262 RepID=A0A160VST4_9EURY|nr:hypothetical protein CHITON_0737 [Thermococcus chitonophagus]